MADPTEAARHGWTAAELARRLGEKAPTPPVDPVRQRVPKSTLQAAMEVHAGQQAQLAARGQAGDPEEQPFRWSLTFKVGTGFVLTCSGAGLRSRKDAARADRDTAWRDGLKAAKAAAMQSAECQHLVALHRQLDGTEVEIGQAKAAQESARVQVCQALGAGQSPATAEASLQEAIALVPVLEERLQVLKGLEKAARVLSDRVIDRAVEAYREQRREASSQARGQARAELGKELLAWLKKAAEVLVIDEVS